MKAGPPRPALLAVSIWVLASYLILCSAILLDDQAIAQRGHPIDLALRAAVLTFPVNFFMIAAPLADDDLQLALAVGVLVAVFIGAMLIVRPMRKLFSSWWGVLAYAALSAATTSAFGYVMLNFLSFPRHH